MELIQKFKNVISIYNEVDQISNTIRHKNKLSDVIEELGHYPQSILIMTVIESAKKINRLKKKADRDDVLIEVQELISHVYSIAKNIDMNLLEEQLNKEVH